LTDNPQPDPPMQVDENGQPVDPNMEEGAPPEESPDSGATTDESPQQ
jgi:hypothetical protein